jgi:hypothetical protein
MATDMDKVDDKLDRLLTASHDIQGDVRVLRHNYNNLKQSMQLHQEQNGILLARIASLELTARDNSQFIATFKRVLWIIATLAVPTLASMAIYFPRGKL